MSMELADAAPEGPSVRSAVESAVATHAPSPDVTSAINGAIEQRDQEHRGRSRENGPQDRQRDRYSGEGASNDRRRADIRTAVTDARIKAAQGSTAPQPMQNAEAPIGPPPTWDTKAKPHWDSLPQEARLAILRDHSQIKPHLERYAELDKVLAPAREVYQSQGVKSDADAVRALVQWEAAIRNPATRLQALGDLMRQYGVGPEMLGGSPQQYQQPQHSPQDVANAERQVSQFSQGRPHFAQVRETMGLLLDRHGGRYVGANGSVNLDAAYRDACKVEGLTDRPQPPAVPRDRGRAPTGRVDPIAPRSTGVAKALREAFAAHRR